MIAVGSSVTLLQALTFNAGHTAYYNAFGSEGQLTLSQTGYVDPQTGKPFNPDPTIQSFVPSSAAAVTAGGVAVYLAQSLYNQSMAGQAIYLVQELLHISYGGGIQGSDVANALRFGLSYNKSLTGDALVAAAGNAMNAWLEGDCGGSK